jgi:hypothetical protein
MSSPHSTSSRQSEDPEIEFSNVKQVKALYEALIDKHTSIQDEIEVCEVMDDDIQELREKSMDKYEFSLLAEAYEAAGEKTTAAGLRNQADDCDERIEELQSNLENIDIKDHMMHLYELEIRRETYEVQMKACEIYLKKSKQRNYVDKKQTVIKAASPRRYPKAASPSRLGNGGVTTKIDNSPRSSPKETSRETSDEPKIALPKISLLPLPLLPSRK